MTKPTIYAEHGIRNFWRIDALDRDAPRLEAYALDAATGKCVLDVEFGPGETGTLERPWPITVNMAHFASSYSG